MYTDSGILIHKTRSALPLRLALIPGYHAMGGVELEVARVQGYELDPWMSSVSGRTILFAYGIAGVFDKSSNGR